MQELLREDDVFTCALFPTTLSYHYGRTDGCDPVIDRTRMSANHGSVVGVTWTEHKDGWERKREVTLDLSVEEAIDQVRFRVTATRMQGGGTGHGPHDVYPDGHHVTAVEVGERGRTVEFYQSGCFVGTCRPETVDLVTEAPKVIQRPLGLTESPNQAAVRKATQKWFPHAYVEVLPRLLVPQDLGENREVVLVVVDEIVLGRGEIDGSTPKTMQDSIDALVLAVEIEAGPGPSPA